MSDHGDFPELTDAEKARWRAVMSDMTGMSAGLQDGSATREDIDGALGRLMACDIDREKLINSLHIPADAGPYGPALERILRRIPDGWGRWLSHDAGWYPIVIACDERLAAVDPDYVVHQVKEKFGTLRYYCAPSGQPSPQLYTTFENITGDAERTSAITCERCGAAGVRHRGRYLVKTLCVSCAETLGYALRPPDMSEGMDS